MAYKDDYDTPTYAKRTERNRELYNSYDNQSYDQFDVNSNQEVLKRDARKIDVDQIRDMLDKKYRDDMPKRKSIDIEMPLEEDDFKEPTKEYDLNNILNRAVSDKSLNYEKERLSKAYTGSNLVDEIHSKYKEKEETDEEIELKELINTITALELKNSKKDAELLDLEETKDLSDTLAYEKKDDFYTGELKVNDSDYDDFKDMQDDIKSNNVLIKVLVFIFIIIVIAIGVVVANDYFELELFLN